EAGTLRKIRECQVPSLRKLNPAIPPELERIVNKSLAKDKSLRYQTAAAFHRDLNRFFNTQYPEFSSHDFSLFMKSAFSQMFMDNRKKLIEFAKSRPELGDHTTVTHTSTLTGTEEAELDLGENLEVETNTVPIDLSDLKRKAPTKQPSFYGNNPATERRMKPRSNHRPSNNTKKIQVPKKKSVARPIFFTLMTLSIAFFSYFFYVTYFNKPVRDNSMPDPMVASSTPTPTPDNPPQPVVQAPPNAEQPPAQEKGEITLGSKQEMFTVIIQSSPSGARISIDGQDTGMITPSQRVVEANKEFTIALRKDGYQYYERKVEATAAGHVVNASLLPMPKMGYINLELTNGGSNPVVFINGLRIEEKLPLKNYAVLAGTPVKIRVHNPFSGLSAEQEVTVGNNQRINVNLILSQRKPSNQQK
ncbi:MAG: PEGA domain-containing protein, partial [Pseudobdellovibrionaceae bacterium]